ncbi:MAG: DUF2953 domain-containing protein [Firmicutes bacterium]|nr:DUF2953 domain-containing protein [Bacillota bacterium]
MNLLFLLFLFGALVLPVRFHLHLHGRGNVFFFFIEMGLPPLRFLNHTFLFTLESPEKPGTPSREGARVHTPEVGKKGELPAVPGLVPGLIPAGLNQVNKLLSKYGVGGTFLYLLLPSGYRRWLSVTQDLEKRGRFSRFNWGTVVGCNDAALTGIATGLLWGVKESLLQFFLGGYRFGPESPRIVILPRFKTPGWETMLDCIFAVQVGHIILAGVKGFIYSMIGGEKHGGPPD